MNKVEKKVLYNLYVEEQKPMHQIAKELKISIGSVFNYLKQYCIPTRSHKETFTMMGRTLSDKHKQIISQRHKGKILSLETRNKIAEAHKKGGIGHKKERSDGYVSVYFPDHPKSTAEGYIMEHILVMECCIGRHLQPDEVVHHKNHIRNDNRKENLQLMTFREHAGLHMKERQQMQKGGVTYQ